MEPILNAAAVIFALLFVTGFIVGFQFGKRSTGG